MNHCTFMEVSTPMEINIAQTKENVICKEDIHAFTVSRRSSYMTWIGSSLDFLSGTNVLLSNRFFQGHLNILL